MLLGLYKATEFRAKSLSSLDKEQKRCWPAWVPIDTRQMPIPRATGFRGVALAPPASRSILPGSYDPVMACARLPSTEEGSGSAKLLPASALAY
jgi:hypothetical protein